MKICYKKLWMLLLEKEMNKKVLREKTGLSSSTIAKLGKGENVNTKVLLDICSALDCDLFDIMELVKVKPEQG